jgi:NAD(P) transhydrogenase
MAAMNPHYDAIVIGAGPAGEGAAMQLVKNGKRVAVIEEYTDVGGGCTHWGTIPSKALRHAVQQLADYRSHPVFQAKVGYIDVSYAELLQSATSVIADQVSMRRTFYFRNRVDVIHGRARFTGPNSIEVATSRGIHERYDADHFVIATGSSPYRPDEIDFTHPLVRDSDTVLQPDVRQARSVTIYGAGVIGSEYASIFATLGLKVDLVNTRDRLLSFLDDEITDALSYHLRNQGVIIRNNETFDSVEYSDDEVVLCCKSGKRFKNDILLWANGRQGNSAALDLEPIGVECDHRGSIEVNKSLQTALPHIYAAGDVIGPPALASASYDQGRFAAAHIVKGESDWNLVKDIPTGIYTNPEISSLGRTERELTEQCVPYEVGRAMFKSIARAQITGHTVGMVKILFHTETLEILGIHCFGQHAAEIVHIGQAVMSQKGEGNTLMYFVETTFNYPTMAEAYRVAALNGLNRVR